MNRHEAVVRCYQIPGVCWPSELGAIYDLFRGSMRHIEVGSFCGRSLFVTAMTLGAGAELFAVEPFIGCDSAEFPMPSDDWQRKTLYATIEAIEKYRPDIDVQVFEMSSIEALRGFPGNASSVYIDACHHFAECSADIQGWRSRLDSEGILAGHDYWPCCPGVMDAVQATVRHFRVIPDTRIWVAGQP